MRNLHQELAKLFDPYLPTQKKPIFAKNRPMFINILTKFDHDFSTFDLASPGSLGACLTSAIPEPSLRRVPGMDSMAMDGAWAAKTFGIFGCQ